MLEPNIPSFYWHDYETFGLRSLSDRPVQFAGLRTTMDFEPVGDPDLWYARPALDYLPQPEGRASSRECTPAGGACKGTCPRPTSPRGSSSASIRRARSWWATTTCALTTTSRARSSRRNVFDLYSHQFKNGCSRWDVFFRSCSRFCGAQRTRAWSGRCQRNKRSGQGVACELSVLKSSRKANGNRAQSRP